MPVLPLEAPLIGCEEPVEVMEKHSVEDHAFRMARTIDSRHIGNADSKNVPGAREEKSGGWTKGPVNEWLSLTKKRSGRSSRRGRRCSTRISY
jgi:hypothetical protein